VQHFGVHVASHEESLVEETDIERLPAKMDETIPDVAGTSATDPPRPGGLTSS
jgi:hypothetical protein